jgi:hypothetical protein
LDPNVRFLDPEVLELNRAVQRVVPDESVDHGGDWTAHYRIWEAVGRGREDNNQSRTIGSMEVGRTAGGDPARFELAIRHRVLMGDKRKGPTNGVHEIRATMTCRNDLFGTPERWRVEHVIHRDGRILDHLGLIEEGESEGNEIRLRINGIDRRVPTPRPWTSDWNLFELVPRFVAAGRVEARFDLMEKLRLHKPDQRLFRDESREYESPRFGRMRKVSQTGRGILPFEYWLDQRGRLEFAVNLHTAYILDADADAKLRRIIDERIVMRFEEGDTVR